MTSGANVSPGLRLGYLRPALPLLTLAWQLWLTTAIQAITHHPCLSSAPRHGRTGHDPRVYGILQPSPCMPPKSFEKFCQVRQLADSPASLIRGACVFPVSSPVVLRAPSCCCCITSRASQSLAGARQELSASQRPGCRRGALTDAPRLVAACFEPILLLP